MSPRNWFNNGQTLFYGRGGAGNAHKEDEAASPPDPGTVPTLKNKFYTTGRGGSGNMAENDLKHPEIARRRQDVDVTPAPLVVENNFPTGRGGAGNIHNLTRSEIAEAKQHNDHVLATIFT